MNIYKQLFIILLSVFPFTANAFVDIPDNIIIEGKVHELYDYPLEKNTELAKKLREILPEKVTLDGKVWEHTNCSREYVATWEIADNKLFLRKIEFAQSHCHLSRLMSLRCLCCSQSTTLHSLVAMVSLLPHATSRSVLTVSLSVTSLCV